jgi:hypothetical protein
MPADVSASVDSKELGSKHNLGERVVLLSRTSNGCDLRFADVLGTKFDCPES